MVVLELLAGLGILLVFFGAMFYEIFHQADGVAAVLCVPVIGAILVVFLYYFFRVIVRDALAVPPVRMQGWTGRECPDCGTVTQAGDNFTGKATCEYCGTDFYPGDWG